MDSDYNDSSHNNALKSINDMHIPEDAGEYEEDIKKILAKIPLGWGRWISCEKGWYPLIIELDQKLTDMAPNYEIHQIKEKFGTLRYYISLPNPEPECCIHLDSIRPHKGALHPRWLFGQERTLLQQYELDKWYYEDFLPHLDGEDHKEKSIALEPQINRNRELVVEMEKLIREYEDISARTCEITGTPGVLMRDGYWYKTLNPEHAPKGYVIASEAEDDLP